MKVFYSPGYEIALPGHIWPTSKYRLIAGRLRPDSAKAASGPVIVEPTEASWEDLALVHTGEYLAKLRSNTLTPEDIRGYVRRGDGRAR